MVLSRSSKAAADPLSDVLDTLGWSVTRRTRLEAAGQWALAFPAVDRLKFVALLRGHCWMLLPGRAPQVMTAGDVCLLGRTPYTVASDPEEAPVDGHALYELPRRDVARLGGNDVIGLGGTVTFAGGSANFLFDVLPDFLFVPRSSPASSATATILGLMNDEAERSLIGSDVVSARLADILLVEAIRAYSMRAQPDVGRLGALADPRLGRVLRAIHGDVAASWTVDRLATPAGMSRAGFSAEFTRRVGRSPLAYGPGSPLAKLVEVDGRVLMVGAPWDTMTLIHHADHLARVEGKRILRYEVPFAGPDGTAWQMVEEFDTTEPILPGMADNYIERIVTEFVEAGGRQQGRVGQAASLLVNAAAMLRFAASWIERWKNANESDPVW